MPRFLTLLITCSLLTMGRLPLMAAWTDPTVLIYRMDQTPVSTLGAISDATGNTSGTVIKTPLPSLIAGAHAGSGSSWDFAGVPSYISVRGINPVLAPLGDVVNSKGFTIAFWARHNFPVSGGDTTNLLSYGKTFRVAIARSAIIPTGFIRFFLGDSTNIPALEFHTPAGLLNGTWHHYAATVDLTSATSNIGLYIDGVAIKPYQDSNPSPTFQISNPFNSSFTSVAGTALQIGADISGNRPYPGQLDHVALFSYPLRAAEISQLYSSSAIANFAPIVAVASSSPKINWPGVNQVTLSGTVEDDGLPSGSLTRTWTKVSGPGTVSFGDSTALVTTATFSAAGTYVLALNASDGSLTGSKSVTVTVASNQAPVVYASVGGKPATSVLAANPAVALNGGALDDDLPAQPGSLSYAWTLDSAPPGGTATFGSATSPNTSANPSAIVGTYIFRLTVSDGALSGSATATVTVAADLPPVFTSAGTDTPILLWPQNSVPLTASVVSPSGKPLTYAWSQVNGPGTTVFASPTAANTTARFSAPGVYQLRITSTNAGLSSFADVWVNVWEKTPGVSPPTSVRRLSIQPEPYVHPRLFFTAADRPELLSRATTDSVAMSAIATMTANVNGSLYAPASILGQTYTQMLAGNTAYDITAVVNDLDFYGRLAQACYLAWIHQDTDKLADLAKVTGTACRCVGGGGGDESFAICYDLTFNQMTEDQRASARAVLAAATGTTVSGFRWGNDFNLSGNNDLGFADYLTPSQVIFGETGFSSTTSANNATAIGVFASKWGTTESGFGRDDAGYFALGMNNTGPAALAFGRNGNNNYITGRFYLSALQAFWQMEPRATGDGTTNIAMLSHGDSDSWCNGGGPGVHYLMLKYMFPTDPMIDWVYRVQLPFAYINKAPLYFAIFGQAQSPGTPSFASVASAKAIPLSIFDAQRGMAITRSDWTEDAARLDFDCRFDTFNLAHMHGDRNNFTFYALGREWAGDLGFHVTDNAHHSTILIDGIGQSDYPSIPGKFLDAIDSNPLFALYSGDAINAYSFWKDGNLQWATEIPVAPRIAAPFTWADHFFPGSSDGTKPAFSPPATILGNNSWINNGPSIRPTPYNPVQRAFRSTLFVRGAKPYLLVLDDIQKDNAPHKYQWLINSVTNYTQPLTAALRAGATATDAILYHTTDGSGNGVPQCLVRALEADGEAVPIAMNTDVVQGIAGRRVIIERDNVVAPNFKVLLYPHRVGETLPATTWNADGTVLTISIPGGTTDTIAFRTAPDGRTRIASFSRGTGVRPPVISVPAPINIPTTDGTGTVVNFNITATSGTGAPLAVSTNPASGSFFPIGSTLVNAYAVDGAGNAATATFTVTVTDAVPPVITAPLDVTLEATGPEGVVYNFTATATDAVSGPVTIQASPASGTTFALGRTTVTVTARDAAGNQSVRTFTVTVEPARTLPVQGTNLKLHLDASKPSTLVTDINGRISRWNDASGGTSYVAQSTTSSQPTATVDGGLGRGIVDFGPFVGNATGQWMQFRDSTGAAVNLAAIRSVFMVMKGSNFLLGDDNTFHFHRNNATPGSATSPLWDSSFASANIRNGQTYLNGGNTPINGTTVAMPDDFWLASVVTLNNVEASRLASDRTARSGGQQIAELLIYDRVLTDSERKATESYLMLKWFGIDLTSPEITGPATSKYWDTGAASGLQGGTGTWNTGITALWNTALDGTAGRTPFWNSNTAIFRNGTPNDITVSGPVNVGGITQSGNGTSTTISGGTLLFNGNGGISNGMDSGDSALNINSGLTLNTSILAVRARQDVVLAGAVDEGVAGAGITKTGEGTLTLSGPNSYSGNTTLGTGPNALPYISDGILRLAHNQAAGASTLVINGGYQAGGLELADGITVANPMLLQGRQGLNYAAISNRSGNNTLSGGITVSANGSRLIFESQAGTLTVSGPAMSGVSGRLLTFKGAGNGVFSKNITSAVVGSVDMRGTGTWRLQGTNTHTAGTTINAGTLVADTTGTLGSGNVTVAAGAACDLRNAAGAVNDAASIYLTGSGRLVISAGVSETVAKLYIDGLLAKTGTWNASRDPVHFSGAGRLIVTDGAPLTPAENWRQETFGTINNAGNAADLADPNNDGELNLLEFATAQNPNSTTLATTTLVNNGAVLEFTYTRSKAALTDGVGFIVEWTDTFNGADWSTSGVTEQILSDNGTVQSVKASVAAGSGRRFMHLKVTKP